MTSPSHFPPVELRYHVSPFRQSIRYSAEQVAQMLNYAAACDSTFSERFDDAATLFGFNGALYSIFSLHQDGKGGYLCQPR